MYVHARTRQIAFLRLETPILRHLWLLQLQKKSLHFCYWFFRFLFLLREKGFLFTLCLLFSCILMVNQMRRKAVIVNSFVIPGYSNAIKNALGTAETTRQNTIFNTRNLGICYLGNLELSKEYDTIIKKPNYTGNSECWLATAKRMPLYLTNNTFWELINTVPAEAIHYTWAAFLHKYYDKQPVNLKTLIGYVYGILCAPTYVTEQRMFMENGFPTIPFVKSEKNFRTVAKAGYDLLLLHTFTGKTLADKRVGRTPFTEFRYVENQIIQDPKERSMYTKGRGLRINDDYYIPFCSAAACDFTINSYPVIQSWLEYYTGQELTRPIYNHLLDLLDVIESTMCLLSDIETVFSPYAYMLPTKHRPVGYQKYLTALADGRAHMMMSTAIVD